MQILLLLGIIFEKRIFLKQILLESLNDDLILSNAING